jgi:hypothetical protein
MSLENPAEVLCETRNIREDEPSGRGRFKTGPGRGDRALKALQEADLELRSKLYWLIAATGVAVHSKFLQEMFP